MRFVDKGVRTQKISKETAVFLAGCGLVRASKALGSLRYGINGFLVFVIPTGYRTEDYEAAAYAIVNANRDDWVDKEIRVRLANPPRIKGTLHKQISIYDLKGLDVLIARNIAEVPKDVGFAAAAVLFVEPPTVRHINAARRLSGKAPFSEQFASSLARRPQNILLAAVLKPTSAEDRIREIDDLDKVDSAGPDLFELPGYEEVKPWARVLVNNVTRWRQGGLEWKLARAGVLLSGLPGTGKTLFASALASALGMRLVSTTIGSWQSAGALGDMLAAMRKTFESVNDGKGAVFFIDEFDAIGTRLARPSGHHGDQYWQVVVDDFLTLLSGLGEGVIVVAATNYPEWIDGAILRAGRIDDHFTLSLPDQLTRAEILNHHTGGALSVESLVDVAEDLDGKTGADLERLVLKACKTARNEDRELELRDLIAQLPERLRYTPQQQLRLAVHEAGHALVALALGHATSATIEIKDSFEPNADGFLGGMTTYDLVPDYFPTETSLLNRIAVSLAGMAAEAAIFGDRSLGSGGTIGSDVERATTVARRMIGSYGLGKTPVFMGTVKEIGDKPFPERLEAEVLQILDEQLERVLAMLTEESERVLALAADVVTHRTVKIERGGMAEAA
ncbi:AAA family ATPase [Rhizobium leguminosarum]|uniref:AAA family ATPase n=1 Tax=Rhizobium leguminosarum TaxID=384 RepID=UPI001C96ABF9|nr:AAA family ATPase [Rhizobium leguminosarum]MBY5798410.1 AAA family ATPase [Rhizobium leguminosarum]